jgi:signal peptidase II
MDQIESLENKNKRTAKGSFIFWSVIFLLAVALDQSIKYLAFNTSFGNFLNGWRPIIAKQNFRNFQFAFSWPVPVWLMYIIYAAVMIGVVTYIVRNYKNFSMAVSWGWLLILAGASSNILERIIVGYVKDFFYIWHGIFNLADGYILIGLLILLLSNKSTENFNDKNEQK